MRNRLFLVALAGLFLLPLFSSPAQAQWWNNRFEFDPNVGYQTSGSFPIVNNAFRPPSGVPGDRLRADGGLSYGTFIDYSITRNAQFEFGWNRNSTTYRERLFPSNTYVKAFNSDIDQFQFGFLYMVLSDEHRIRPFIAGGVGFAHEFNSGATPNRTDFSYNIGGGVKYMLNQHFGLRGDARYVPVYKNSSPAVFCDPFGFCFVGNVANFLSRGNFSGGLIFRF